MKPVKASLNKKCACEGGTLDRFIQPSILLILTWGESNGYMIIKQMRELSMFSEGLPDATGVYRYIKMMEGRGLIKSREEACDGGKLKKLYTITDDGRECLKNWKTTLEDYRNAIGELIEMIGQESI